MKERLSKIIPEVGVMWVSTIHSMCVRILRKDIERIDYDAADGPVIHVLGADLMDGTPIYDIKPYLEYADSHANIRSGFVDSNRWQLLDVVFPSSLASRIPGDMLPALIKVLEQDPRPQYHNDAEKIYGMQYATFDIRFRVNGTILTVVDVLSAD